MNSVIETFQYFFYLFLHLRSKIKKKNLKIKRSLNEGNKTYDKRKNKNLCETWTCGKQWEGLGQK